MVRHPEFIYRNFIPADRDEIVRIKIPVLFQYLDGGWQEVQLCAVAEKVEITFQPDIICLALLIGVQAEGYLVFVPDRFRHQVSRVQLAVEKLPVGVYE